MQSENVVLDEQDVLDEDEDVEDSDFDDELSSSSSFALFSMSVRILLISSRYSEPFLIVFSISFVHLDPSSGIVLIMLSAIGSVQLIASSAMFLAAFTASEATLAALEARFAPNRDLFTSDPEQGDFPEG